MCDSEPSLPTHFSVEYYTGAHLFSETDRHLWMSDNSPYQKLQELLCATADFCELETKLAKPVVNILDYGSKPKKTGEDEDCNKASPTVILLKADLDKAKPGSFEAGKGNAKEIFRFNRTKIDPKPEIEIPAGYGKEWKKKGFKGKEGEQIPEPITNAWKRFDAELHEWKLSKALPNFYSALHTLYHSPGAEKSVTLGIGMLRSKLHKINHPLIEITLDIAVEQTNILLLPTDSPATFWNFCGVSYEESRGMDLHNVENLQKEAKELLKNRLISLSDPESYKGILDLAKNRLSSSIQKVERHEDVDITVRDLPDEMQIVDTWAIYKACPNAQHAIKKDCEGLCSKLRNSPGLCPDWALRFVEEFRPAVPQAKTNAPPPDHLFPLDCNKEQLDILKKLDAGNAVVVRGPPGTGKTHTVANMICHFLAKKQRILVISEGPEALKVIRKKILEAVAELENFMVFWPNVKEGVDHVARAVEEAMRGIGPDEQERLEMALRDKSVETRNIRQIEGKLKYEAGLRLTKLNDSQIENQAPIESCDQSCETLRTCLVAIITCLDSRFLKYSPEELVFKNDDGPAKLQQARVCFRMADGKVLPTEGLINWSKEMIGGAFSNHSSAAEELKKRCDIISKLTESDRFPNDWRGLLITRCVDGYLQFLDERVSIEMSTLERRRALEKNLHRKYIRAEVAVKVKEAVQETIQANASLPITLSQLVTALQSTGASRKKNSSEYLSQAKSLLQDPAVVRTFPLWIMPTSKVSDFLPSELGYFDLVILDEASQSGIGCLPVLLRGKKLLIIGDEKQVSPGDHATDFEEEVKKIQKRRLQGFPFNDLSCALPIEGHSIFDLCLTAFANETCLLREHFRCLNGIIQFSSDQFYNGNLIAVRHQPKFKNFGKALELRPVSNGKRENEKNLAEAEAIVDEVVKIIQQEEKRAHASKPTIGIISLWGYKQAKLIRERLAASKIVAGKLEDYKIKCGDAFEFQGDERDIVLTSMVADKNSKPVPDTGMRLKRNDQNFNVAASRARDCLYLFYSESLNQTLNGTEDIRQKFLNFFIQRLMKRKHSSPGKNPQLPS